MVPVVGNRRCRLEGSSRTSVGIIDHESAVPRRGGDLLPPFEIRGAMTLQKLCTVRPQALPRRLKNDPGPISKRVTGVREDFSVDFIRRHRVEFRVHPGISHPIHELFRIAPGTHVVGCTVDRQDSCAGHQTLHGLKMPRVTDETNLLVIHRQMAGILRIPTPSRIQGTAARPVECHVIRQFFHAAKINHAGERPRGQFIGHEGDIAPAGTAGAIDSRVVEGDAFVSQGAPDPPE